MARVRIGQTEFAGRLVPKLEFWNQFFSRFSLSMIFVETQPARSGVPGGNNELGNGTNLGRKDEGGRVKAEGGMAKDEGGGMRAEGRGMKWSAIVQRLPFLI
jgi:hypothetical protein